jgi:hypothetical protein
VTGEVGGMTLQVFDTGWRGCYSPKIGGALGRHPRSALLVGLVLLLFLAIPLDAHAEWFLERQLDKGPYGSFLSSSNTDCIVADDSGNVHVVWIRPWRGWGDVYYTGFDDGGWTAPAYVGGELATGADLAAGEGGKAHLVWTENWTDYSEWSPEFGEVYRREIGVPPWGETLPVAGPTDSSASACVAAGREGWVHFVWRDKIDGHFVLFHDAWRPGGYSGHVAAASTDSVGKHSLAADPDGNLHLVWCDYRQGNWEIYYKTFDGSTWGTEERLTESPGASLEASLAAGNDGSLHLVWVEKDGIDSEVFYSCLEGAAWSAPHQVRNSPGSAVSPSVAVDLEGRPHAVWVDDRDGGSQVYYSCKAGASWAAAERVTETEAEARNPGIAVDASGIVHVVWQDNRDGLHGVYWKALYPGKLPLPKPQAVEPGSAYSGDVIDSLRIFGSGFVAPASAWMVKWGEPAVRFDSVRVVSPDEIVCVVDLLRVHHGDWDVIVENPNGSRDTLKSAFHITPFTRPVAFSLEPKSMESNLGLHVESLVGHNFVSPVSIWLERGGEKRLVAIDTKVRSPDTLECAVNLGGATPGMWNVVVENPDGRRDTVTDGFRVLPASWSEDVRLTDDPGGSMTGYSHSRTVAVDGEGRVYVVWYDNRSGHYEIYYKVLEGGVWSPDMEVTSDEAVSAHPAVATGPEGSLHVVWHDRRHGYEAVIYYRELTGGLSGPEERISTSDREATKPAIAVDANGDVHIVWCEARQVIYRRRAGGVWQEEVSLTEPPGRHAFASVEADDMGFVHVVWQGNFEESSRHSQIHYTWFDGEKWWPPLRLSYAGDDCLAPTVATGPGGTAHFVWHDGCGEDLCEIYYTAWDRKNWHPQEAITSAPGKSKNACVAVDDSGGVHVVWQDDRNESQEMYYKSYNGSTWSADVRLNATQSLSRKPSTAVARDGRLHVVWHDDRDGNWEIYYKSLMAQAPLSPPPRLVRVKRIMPNPTVGPCTIFAEVDGAGRVVVDVYDVTGRLVWRGRRASAVPGLIGLLWDGCGRDGRPVAPGVYLVRVSALKGSASGKVIVLR